MPPQWKDARYESLSPEVRELYDAYAKADEASRELGRKLQLAATSEWLANHPNGIDGKFISFNVNGGRLRWVMASKKPSGNYKTVGEDVPSVGTIKRTEAEIEAVASQTRISEASPTKISAMAKRTWSEVIEFDQLGLMLRGFSEESWNGMSREERESKLQGFRSTSRYPEEDEALKQKPKQLTPAEKLALAAGKAPTTKK
jgi:hypothetical protein